jgi:pentatricopeptide repeat protein
MAALNRANKAFEALAIFDRMLANKCVFCLYVVALLRRLAVPVTFRFTGTQNAA